MNASDKIKALLALQGKKIIDLADYFGMTRQGMSNKMMRGSWSASDLEMVAKFVDCDLFFETRDKQRIYLFSKGDKQSHMAETYNAEQTKRFLKLDRRMNSESREKMFAGKYPKNEFGVIVIPAMSDADKPSDVSSEEWHQFMDWKFGDER